MELSRLPPELLQKIFGHLSIDELQACKFVCKRLLTCVNGFNLNKLYLYRLKPYKDSGFFGDLKIFFNVRDFDDFNRFIFQPSGRCTPLAEFAGRAFLCNITELYLGDNVVIGSNSYDFLNNFQILKILRFGALLDKRLNQIKFRKKLVFPYLRTLSIQFSAKSKSAKVTIDAPCLKRLQVSSSLLSLQLPQSRHSLVYLSADQYKNWMDQMENLEQLRCDQIHTDFETSAIRWTKLKRFEVQDAAAVVRLRDLKRTRNDLHFEVYSDDLFIENLEVVSLLPHANQ